MGEIALVVLLFATTIVVVGLYQRWEIRRLKRRWEQPNPMPIDATPDTPKPFGYKIGWLAIKSTDTSRVVASLPIRDVEPANWATGIPAAYAKYVFVSPPTRGWTLVPSFLAVGIGDEERWRDLIQSLSSKFGEVQGFASYRVPEHHAWLRCEDGIETRALIHTGESGRFESRGNATEAEITLGYQYFDPNCAEAKSEEYWQREDLTYPDEHQVMELAELWSLDPSTLDELETEPATGWVGQLDFAHG